MNTIGSTLKAIREEKKLLLQDVATKTSINKTLLSRIETDNRMPTRDQVNLLI
jgi:cytoskeletal protein RodZ